MQRLLSRLAWTDHLSRLEQDRLVASVSRVQQFDAGDQIVPAERPVDYSSAILDGFSCRQKVLENGSRQITAFHVPGDFCDLHTYLLKTLPDSVMAMTACRVALVPHDAIHKIVAQSPHLTALFWKSTLVDASINRQWIVSIGRRSAVARVAHLFCELYARLKLVGLAKELKFRLPATQSDLSDATGMSLVHTNRTCGSLRQHGLATFSQRTVTIHSWQKLQRVAEFNPEYLHIGNGSAPY
ncbi:MAG TPA: Crp/Fnr family transcriptional regulator [Pseudolabrys sp.]|nr:Crp/Fnr family transcriptional regulator [Pseudolabrys sp.]